MATVTKSKRTSLRIRVMLLDVLDAARGDASFGPITLPDLARRLGPGAPHESTIRRALADLIETREVVCEREAGRLARYST